MKRKRGYKSDLRAQHAAATRDLIIKTAAEQFVPWSTDVPFDQLAERAGISVRTVFRHFPTQRDLVVAERAFASGHRAPSGDRII